jgi:hypothetical protein
MFLKTSTIILQHECHIYKKTAPLTRYFSGIVRAKACKTIHIIALDNEVKEILWSYIPITMEKLPLKRLTS